MTAEAGWYPDPMGDTTKLRYWNGAVWTDDYAPAQTQAGTASASGTQPAQAATGTASTAADPNAQAATAQPAATAAPTPQPTVTVNVQQPAPAATATPAVYPMTDTDRTLRLVAFILNLLTAIGCCWLIIPLAWQIPMTVRSYGIYKGTKPNTVAMGVCTLIFVNIISGVLLLCSKKDA